MENTSKNFIANLKKQKHENKALLFLDNVKIIRDALKNKTIKAQYILTSLSDKEFESLEIDCTDVQVFHTDTRNIEMLADTKTPQKVLCIAYLTQYVVETPKTNFLVLDSLQDPGNVGTLIRTAKACGFEYIFLLDSVRRQNEKLVRSSVGAVFDSKVYEMTKAEFADFAKTNDLCLVMTDMDGENIFDFVENLHKNQSAKLGDKRSAKKTVLGVVVGNEGAGVCKEIELLCKFKVKIPMKAGIESLNAGVSGSIIMYEINKNEFFE